MPACAAEAVRILDSSKLIPIRLDRTMSGHYVARLLLGATIALVALTARAQTVLPPVPISGPYPVACTNIEQDLTRVAAGETAEMYWRGASSGGKERYVDALLVSPA